MTEALPQYIDTVSHHRSADFSAQHHGPSLNGKLATVRTVLSKEEASNIVQSSGDLPSDPACAGVANRGKAIAFVICTNGRWYQINHSTFYIYSAGKEQGESYDFAQLPHTFIDCDATQKLLNAFKSQHGIPDGQFVLVQVQSSNLLPHEMGKLATSQGPHSDGSDKAMITCLLRSNVQGATNQVMYDLDGQKPVIDPVLLDEGDSLFWDDNQVYHSVSPAHLVDQQREGKRTVLIAHYPALHYITGERNQNNLLMMQDGDVKSYETFLHFNAFENGDEKDVKPYKSFVTFNAYENGEKKDVKPYKSFVTFNAYENGEKKDVKPYKAFVNFNAFENSEKKDVKPYKAFVNFNAFDNSEKKDTKPYKAFVNFNAFDNSENKGKSSTDNSDTEKWPKTSQNVADKDIKEPHL